MLPSRELESSAQDVQNISPDAPDWFENLPVAQFMQADSVSAAGTHEYLPAAQSRQGWSPEVSLYFPLSQALQESPSTPM